MTSILPPAKTHITLSPNCTVSLLLLQIQVNTDNLQCKHCGSKHVIRKGQRRNWVFKAVDQRYQCRNCLRNFNLPIKPKETTS